MLEKLLSPYDYPWPDERIVRPIEDLYASRALTKQASIDVSDIKYERDMLKIHVIALGAGEYWGCNRNGDYFPENALIKYHDTFVRYGNFHKNHKNKPNDPKFGNVEKSWYNPRMHRVELIVAVDLLRYPEFKDEIESGRDIPVSMAAKLPYDICSICGHRRTKPGRENTCSHINDELTKVLSDGRQVYALNLEPKFFDISKVWKPADRTAYVLRKVANSMNTNKQIDQAIGDILKQAGIQDFTETRDFGNHREMFDPRGLNAEYTAKVMNEALDFTKPMHRSSHVKQAYVVPRLRKLAWDKIAFIDKLSELEKRVEGEITGKVEDGKIESIKNSITKTDIPDEVLEAMSELPKATSLGSLADKGIILRPKEFVKIMRPKDDISIDSILPMIRGIFSKLSARSDLESFMPEDYDFESVPEHSKISRIFNRFIEPRSMLREPAVNRAILVVMTKGPKVENFDAKKEDLEKESSYNEAIAIMYGLYKASALKYMLDNCGDSKLDSNNVTAVSAILENYI